MFLLLKIDFQKNIFHLMPIVNKIIFILFKYSSNDFFAMNTIKTKNNKQNSNKH